MTEKIKRYILLFAVVFIWALIIYRVVSYVSPSPLNESYQMEFISDPLTQSIDTFTLLLNYSDPFLREIDNFSINKKQMDNVLNNSKEVVEIKLKEIVWPDISYRGTIKNPQTQKQVFLITVNGKEFLMNISDTIMGVSMHKAYSDSILLTFESRVKPFYKQK